jgi:hypothetical protein
MEALKNWAVAALVRALKSAAEAVLILTGTEAVNFLTLDWTQVAGVAAGMAFASLMFSIAGIPEVEGGASVRTLAKKDAER